MSIKESTYYRYLCSINKYLIPEFGNKKLKTLRKYDFNLFVSKLTKENLSSKNIKNITSLLKSILHYAEDNYHYKFTLDNLNSPKTNKNLLEILSNREKSRLENYCISENSLRALGIVVCLNTGLRIGEICALKWKNIDLDKQILHITCTMQRMYNSEEKKSTVMIDSPKTTNSIRDIPISKKICNILNPLKKKYNDEDFLLTGSKYNFIEPRTYQNIFKEILRKCKIRPYNFHILRHTFATNCVGTGMDIKSLSTILGHSNVNITLNQYVHSSYKTQRKFLEKL